MPRRPKQPCSICKESIYIDAAKCRFCGEPQEEFNFVVMETGGLYFEEVLWLWVFMTVVLGTYFCLDPNHVGNIDSAMTGIMRVFYLLSFCMIFLYWAPGLLGPTLKKWGFDTTPPKMGIMSLLQKRKSMKKARVWYPLIAILLCGLMIFFNFRKPGIEDFEKYLEAETDFITDESITIKKAAFWNEYEVSDGILTVRFIGINNRFYSEPEIK